MRSSGQEGRRVAMVTGASFGLGAAAAVALAEDGCDVVITELAGDASNTRARIEAFGRRAFTVKLDVRAQDSIDQALATTLKEFGRLDVLVNNAGAITICPATTLTRDKWSTIMDVNVTGTFFSRRRSDAT